MVAVTLAAIAIPAYTGGVENRGGAILRFCCKSLLRQWVRNIGSVAEFVGGWDSYGAVHVGVMEERCGNAGQWTPVENSRLAVTGSAARRRVSHRRPPPLEIAKAAISTFPQRQRSFWLLFRF